MNEATPAAESSLPVEPYPLDRQVVDLLGPSDSAHSSSGLFDTVSQSTSLYLDAQLESHLSDLLDGCLRQETLLRKTIELARKQHLRTSIVQRLAVQLRFLEYSRNDLISTLARIARVGMIGTNLLNALLSREWLVVESAKPQLGLPQQPKRPGTRYRLVRPIVQNATWVVTPEESQLFDAEVLELNESGVIFGCDCCIPRGSKVLLPFDLGDFQAICTLRVTTAILPKGTQRWRVAGLFAHN